MGLVLGPIGLAVGWYYVLTAPRWAWRDRFVHRDDDRMADEVMAVAAAADEAGEGYGVISESAAQRWLSGDDLSAADAAHLAGPGNARFAAVHSRLRGEAGLTFDVDSLMPTQMGECYVFPVARGRSRDITDVIALAMFCFGPSEARSYLSLSRS